MRDEQIKALTLIGLVIWNLAAYAASLPTVASPPVTSPSLGNEDILYTIREAFWGFVKSLTCAVWRMSGGPLSATCGGTGAPPPQNQTQQSARPVLQQPPPMFLPIFILTLGSYVNGFWVLVGTVSFKAHSRDEIDDSMGFAALMTLLPFALPIMMLLLALEGRAQTPSEEPESWKA